MDWDAHIWTDPTHYLIFSLWFLVMSSLPQKPICALCIPRAFHLLSLSWGIAFTQRAPSALFSQTNIEKMLPLGCENIKDFTASDIQVGHSTQLEINERPCIVQFLNGKISFLQEEFTHRYLIIISLWCWLQFKNTADLKSVSECFWYYRLMQNSCPVGTRRNCRIIANWIPCHFQRFSGACCFKDVIVRRPAIDGRAGYDDHTRPRCQFVSAAAQSNAMEKSLCRPKSIYHIRPCYKRDCKTIKQVIWSFLYTMIF